MTVCVPAAPAAVWTLIRQFGSVADWNPFLTNSRLVSGVEGEPGAEREVVTRDGTTVRERLEAVDDDDRSLRYRMLSFPIPVSDQTNQIVVSSEDGCVRSNVRFSADFSAREGVTNGVVAAMNRAAFETAGTGLQAHFAA